MRFCYCLICFLWATNAAALEDNIVNWVSQEWVGYTDTEQGLYWQLIEQAFNQEQLLVQLTLMPFKRAVRMVDQKRADFAGAVLKDVEPSRTHIQAPFPIFSTPISVFYRKGKFIDTEIDLNFLKQHSVAGTHQIGKSIGLDSQREVNSKEQAFFMVTKNHADFFLGYADQIQIVVKDNAKKVKNYVASDYTMKNISQSDWFMISPNTQRGEKIMNAYIAGSQKLYDQGIYAAIYSKSGFEVPLQALLYFK